MNYTEFVSSTFEEGDASVEQLKLFEWSPGKRMLKRLRQWQAAGSVVTRKWHALWFRVWKTIASCDLSPETKIGDGFRMPHALGIVIHPRVVIGSNCVIFHNVTLGTRGGQDVPVICDDVEVGPGACVLGKVTVGRGARIGPNCVIVKDVPPGARVVCPTHRFL